MMPQVDPFFARSHRARPIALGEPSLHDLVRSWPPLPRRPVATARAWHPSPSDRRKEMLVDLLGWRPGTNLNTFLDWVDPVTPWLDYAHRRRRGQRYGFEDALLPLAVAPGAWFGGKAAQKGIRMGGHRLGLLSRKSIDKRPPPGYDPLRPIETTPQRPFELDYPDEVEYGAAGRLTRSMDGHQLGAKYVVGRTFKGGSDVALPSEAFDEIAKAGTGQRVRTLTVAAAKRRNVRGIVPFDKRTKRPLAVFVKEGLSPDDHLRTTAHEIGHVIDQTVGEIPVTGLTRELEPLYSTLYEGRARTRNLTLPQHRGYSEAEVPRELMADAIRAYMLYPNYMKTVAPKTAARIRELVNVNPTLRKTIQFNTAAPIALGGGLAATAVTGGIPAPAPAPAPWPPNRDPRRLR